MKRLTSLMLGVAAVGMVSATGGYGATLSYPAAGATGAGSVVRGAGHWQLSQGFILHADDRFDPLVQRIMAEQSLKALPLRGGQLFYIVPVQVDPRIEEMQIRYLEMLLDKQAFEPAAGGP